MIQTDHNAELSLIIALPAFLIEQQVVKKKTRMESILTRIFKHAQKSLRQLPPPSNTEIRVTFTRLSEFFDDMGWGKDTPLDVMMMVSFLLGLIEESKFQYSDLLIDALNDCWEMAVDGKSGAEISEYLRDAEEALNVWHGRKREDAA